MAPFNFGLGVVQYKCYVKSLPLLHASHLASTVDLSNTEWNVGLNHVIELVRLKVCIFSQPNNIIIINKKIKKQKILLLKT